MLRRTGFKTTPLFWASYTVVSSKERRCFKMPVSPRKNSNNFGISLDLHYLCTRNQNVDRFGLLATTVKNAKTTKNSLTIGVCFCLCIFPNSFPIRFIDDLTTSDCR